jgi:hypothetical protein
VTHVISTTWRRELSSNLFAARKGTKGNSRHSTEILGEHAPSYATIKNWVAQSSEQLLEFFRRDPNDFLSQLVTTDETWLYHYGPETKQQSIEWRDNGSPRPKKFPC